MSRLFYEDTEIQKIIKEELELFNNENYKGLDIPNIFENRILERKKLILVKPDKSKIYFEEKSKYLEKIQSSLELRFKEDFTLFKDALGIKKAKELALKSATNYKNILLEGSQYLFPDILDDIAERSLLADARKKII
jgi:hypothetical protein